MAALDLQEQEQIDAIKGWWQENSKWVLGAVTLAAVSFAAYQFWHNYQLKQSAAASTLYGEFSRQLESGDRKRVDDAANAVIDQYGGTAFAPRAQLLAAQTDLSAGDANAARGRLQWVIDHASEDGLKEVARLKQASILLDEKSYPAALALLNMKHAESFDGLYADLRGDVLQAQGDPAGARGAYQLALSKTDEKAVYRNLIQMKLDALGGAQ